MTLNKNEVYNEELKSRVKEAGQNRREWSLLVGHVLEQARAF
jgi:hypothetical protein